MWLVAAMFGSALTLASFMKLIHAIFLGQPADAQKGKRIQRNEIGLTMWIPTVILALFCIIFGVCAYRIPLTMIIFPSLDMDVNIVGIWGSSLATVFIFIGIIIGLIIYIIGNITKTRSTDTFVGGEFIEQYPDMRLSGTDFYNTIKEIGILKKVSTTNGNHT